VNRGAAVLPHQAAAGRFRALTEAYRMLSDPGRRAAYDRALGRARLLRDAAGGAGAAARAGRCDGTAPCAGLPAGEPDPSLAPDDGRTGWHFTFLSLPNLPELLLAGRERPFWTYFARRQMWDPSALAEEDIDEMVHSAKQPGGTRAILEMYRARQTDAEQNRPHYADPISCPVLAVGAQAYLGDAVSRQLPHVARDVRGAVIPASGHNIALENPAALAQAYLDFFADR
jgi:pimeloyl-ACP methyl ester carboxylesterase